MTGITEYLKMKRVPYNRRLEIRAHFDRVFHDHKAVEEKDVLNMMPGGTHLRFAVK